MSNNEALRLINNRQNAHLISWQANACAELRRLHDLLGKANALCRIRAEEIERLKAQPERKPLTDEEIWRVVDQCKGGRIDFARAIEAAHGIKE